MQSMAQTPQHEWRNDSTLSNHHPSFPLQLKAVSISSNEGWEQTQSSWREYSRHALKYRWKGRENTGLFFCLQLASFTASATLWKSSSWQPLHPPAAIKGQSCHGILSPNSQKPCLRHSWVTCPKNPSCCCWSQGPSRETHLHLDIVMELLAGGRKGL